MWYSDRAYYGLCVCRHLGYGSATPLPCNYSLAIRVNRVYTSHIVRCRSDSWFILREMQQQRVFYVPDTTGFGHHDTVAGRAALLMAHLATWRVRSIIQLHISFSSSDLQSIQQIGLVSPICNPSSTLIRDFKFQHIQVVEYHKSVRPQMTGNADTHTYKRTAVFMHTCEQWFAILHIGRVVNRFSSWQGASKNTRDSISDIKCQK